MNEICAKCGEGRPGDFGEFYYGEQFGQETKTYIRTITTTTSYRIRGSERLYICNDCARRRHHRRIATNLMFVIVPPFLILVLILIDVNSPSINIGRVSGFMQCVLSGFILSAIAISIVGLKGLLSIHFEDSRDHVAISVGKGSDQYEYFTRSKRAKLVSENTVAAKGYLDQATVHLDKPDELDKALAECDAAIMLDPYLAEAYNLRGIVLEELGRTPEAVKAYEQAVRLDPSFTEARENLSDLRSEF